MPLDVRLRPAALSDLTDIWTYLATRNETAADRILREIDARFSMLADHPEAGRTREDIGVDLRSFPVESYNLYYRVSGRTLDVIRVLHAARDVTPDLI